MKNINYKQLKRYDIGKMPTDSGYQRGQQISTADFTNTPAYSMSNEVSAVNRNTFHNTASQAATIGKSIYDMTKSMPALLPAATTNVNSAISNGLVTSAGQFTQKGAEAAVKAGFTSAGSGLNAGAAGTEAALKGAGQSVANTGMSAAGYVAGGLGAALGTYGIINDAVGFNDRLRDNDMMNMSARGTASKYGVSYNTYNGLDSQGIRDYTDAQNTSSTMSMTMNGLSTGASIGGIVGSAVPGIGNLIGTIGGGVIGAIGGLIGGLAGSSSRSDKVEESIKNTLAAQHGYNLQAESEAGSKGLRNQYNVTHADKGKNIKLTNDGQQGEIRMVHTAEGIVPGVMLGLAGKGESIYDPIKGKASVFEEGKKRVDNIPTGVSLNEYDGIPEKSKYDAGGAWNRKVIFGNMINPDTGNSFADDAKPYSKVLEDIDKDDMNYLNTHTKQINRMNAMKKLNKLAETQSQVSQYNCGKAGKFDPGKPINPIYTFAQMPFLLKDYTEVAKQQPYAQNSFVANPTARQALDIQAAAKFDPNTLQDRARQLSRQMQYNIDQQGGLSGGQRLKFKMANNTDLMNQNQDILYRIQEANNNHNTAYAKAVMDYGANEAQRGQTALAAQQEAYRQAVGAKQKWKEQSLKNISQLIPAYLQNRSTYDQFMAMYDLYNRQVANDELRTKNDVEKNKPAVRVFTSDSWKNPTPITMPSIDDLIKPYLPYKPLGPTLKLK